MLASGFIALVVGLFQLFGDSSSVPGNYPLYPLGIILLTVGGFLVPFAILKIKSLSPTTNEPVVESHAHFLSSAIVTPVLLAVWVIALLVGYFINDTGIVSTLLRPFLAVLGIVLPIFLYIVVISDKNESLPPSRGWGALSAGMTIAPLFAAILEIGFLVTALIVTVIVIMQDSSLMNNLQITATRLSSSQGNPEVIGNMLSAFVRNPVNRFLILSIVSGLIPITEEVIKQIPLWLLSWRKLTPRAGLMIGGLGGAGFALLEGLMGATSVGGQDQWLYLILGRAGASLMHVLTGAIGGWGLASAIQGRSYIKALLTYITCIVIHGIWNGLAVWEGITRLMGSSAFTTLNLSKDNFLPTILMGVYFLIMLVILIKNKKIFKDL